MLPTQNVKIKICGLKRSIEIRTALKYDANFIGFVFAAKSPRYITPMCAYRIFHQYKIANPLLSPSSVAVIVNPSIQKILNIYKYFQPDYLQIHNCYNRYILKQIIRRFNTPIILSFSMVANFDFNILKQYENIAKYFLFDTPPIKEDSLEGGSGISFNWEILKKLNINLDWFLSGGLNINNIDQALKVTQTKMIDLSSGVEQYRGKKSLTKIKNFLCHLR